MFTKRIIPCLDCKDGRVVKGTSFVNLRDAGDPIEVAKKYDADGADELVFLDITATSDDRNTTVDLVRKVAKEVFIPFTVGGGIRTIDDFKVLLREGADKISVNSAAILNPQLITDAAKKFGSQCVVVAIDAKKREDGGWNIYRSGGRIDTGIDAVQWAKIEVAKVKTKYPGTYCTEYHTFSEGSDNSLIYFFFGKTENRGIDVNIFSSAHVRMETRTKFNKT